MDELNYLKGYPRHMIDKVQALIDNNQLGKVILTKYPVTHKIKTNKALYDYVINLKNNCLKKTPAVSKVIYDDKMNVIKHALGTHTYISRVQGKKLKAKHEIRISSQFKTTPMEFLTMIAVHELAHLREKEHNKAFYKLCEYMEPAYHELEFDMKLYLTYVDLFGKLY